MSGETATHADVLDQAIVDAADLDPKTILLAARRRNETPPSSFRLSAWLRTGNGRQDFFVKTGSGADAAARFAGEYASLKAIADVVPGLCPRAYGLGVLHDQPGVHFLVTDFLLFVRTHPMFCVPPWTDRLAALHTAEMPPVRSGAPADRPFGFPVPTYCGATEQDNTWTASWADFFADRRLRHALRMGQRAHGTEDDALAGAVERTAAMVVPRLLGDGHLQRAAARGGGAIVPVLVHGDLNGHVRVADVPLQRPSVFALGPASVYGHGEYDLGMWSMSGGDWDLYTALVPKDEPVCEWEDRLQLYGLYHHLNQWAIFGSRCRGEAMSIMQKLLEKYA